MLNEDNPKFKKIDHQTDAQAIWTLYNFFNSVLYLCFIQLFAGQTDGQTGEQMLPNALIYCSPTIYMSY